eukprot:12434690-Ditylum_brightwellii.AAC.1
MKKQIDSNGTTNWEPNTERKQHRHNMRHLFISYIPTPLLCPLRVTVCERDTDGDAGGNPDGLTES